MALAFRPITLAWLASAVVHLGLFATAWHGSTTAPRPTPPTGRPAWSTQAPIIAYLNLRAPVSMPGAAGVAPLLPRSPTPAVLLAAIADVAAPRPAVAVAPAVGQAPDASPAVATSQAPPDSNDASDPVAAQMATPPGWGQGGSTWLAHRSVWQEGARQLALQGQARTAAAQHQANQLAARNAHAHYLLTWQQRVGTLVLDGACDVGFAGSELPDVRCHAASDEALLIALALELGPVPADVN